MVNKTFLLQCCSSFWIQLNTSILGYYPQLLRNYYRVNDSIVCVVLGIVTQTASNCLGVRVKDIRIDKCAKSGNYTSMWLLWGPHSVPPQSGGLNCSKPKCVCYLDRDYLTLKTLQKCGMHSRVSEWMLSSIGALGTQSNVPSSLGRLYTILGCFGRWHSQEMVFLSPISTLEVHIMGKCTFRFR